jgi:hypothetical protein
MGLFWSQPASAKPAQECQLTREGLLDKDRQPRLFEDSFCPSCEDFGVRCWVGNHKPAALGELLNR